MSRLAEMPLSVLDLAPIRLAPTNDGATLTEPRRP